MPSSFTLGENYERLLDELVSSGDYTNKSEAMRAALRLLQRDRIQWAAALRAHDEGLADPRPPLSHEEVTARLRSRYTTSVTGGAEHESATVQPKGRRRS